MPEKKLYVSPDIETERLDFPGAWACNVFGATDYNELAGSWSGAHLVESAIINCSNIPG